MDAKNTKLMNRRAALLAMLMLPVGVRGRRAGAPARQDPNRWTPIFNGRDLTAWETFLGKPHKLVEVPGQPRNEHGEYLNALGVVEEKIDHLIDSKRQLSQDLLEGSGEMLLTETKDDDLLKLVALDLHTASQE